MNLSSFLDAFTVNHEFGIRASTLEVWYKPAIADFERFLGRTPTLEDLSRDRVNQWIGVKQQTGCSVATIRTRRNALLALWRAAFEADLVEAPPLKIRKIRVPPKPVEAWTRSEMGNLVNYVTTTMPDRLLRNDLSKRLYFRSLALAAWDTGLRLGDLLSIEREWIHGMEDGAGRITVIQSKTSQPVHCHLAQTTMQSIDDLMAMQPNRRLIWPLWCRREEFYRNFKKIVRDSGIRQGTFRWIRRASATAVELERPGHGYRHAGHTNPSTTNRHYIDRSQFKDIHGPEPLAG